MTKKKKVKNIMQQIYNFRKQKQFGKLAAVILFALVGTMLILAIRAASPTVNFEAESSALTGPIATVSDSAASGSSALKFGSGGGFVHPGVVYTQADIDAWTTSSIDYSNLANTGAGKSYTNMDPASKYYPKNYGSRIDSGGNAECSSSNGTPCELNDGLKDQSGFAKIQAVLWAADGIQARRDRVVAYLDGFRGVTSYEWDNKEQYRLVSGWACTNLAQAAEIINYQDDQFKRFLKDECYPIMDWTAGPNWHASFADSKLAIAAYLGDAELWADAKAYYYERIKQSIWHGSHDAPNKPFPMHSEDGPTGAGTSSSTVPPRLHAPPGTPKIGPTQQNWGRDNDPNGDGQVKSDFTFDTTRFGQPVNGMNAERLRDLAHVNMSLAGWMHGARTILAQGEQLEQHAYDRLLAGYDYHSVRVLHYEQTATYLAPVPYSGTGGGSRWVGYYGAKKLFGTATPQSVLSMLNDSDVKGVIAGFNHTVAEPYADK